MVKNHFENYRLFLAAIAGLFAIYEALSGWCLARACGLKTKI